jgi:hypothetical protein
MHLHRRAQRTLALTCAAAAIAAAPATAGAMPLDPEGLHAEYSLETVSAPSSPAVTPTTGAADDDTTLALAISGIAMIVALGSAGYAGRIAHRFGHPGP